MNKIKDYEYETIVELVEEIKREIVKKGVTQKSNLFWGITGSAGTGKTLLLYDIMKYCSGLGRACVIHSGILCDGHTKLNALLSNADIIDAKSVTEDMLEGYEYIFVDEAQRIYSRTLAVMLPKEEADMMIGKTIVISEETFVTYDNYREPTSEIANRTEDGFWLDKIRMENPEYKVKTVRANEIYGIRDGMFTGELAQEEYVEVDAYPGYQTNREWSLPQMFLTSDGRILMYAMGEYFLLEKMENSQGRAESDNMPDLSGWIGRYAFSEEGTDYRSTKLVPSESNGYGGFYVYSDLEVYNTLEVTREYEIEIMKNSLGEYYAEIKIHEMEDGTDTLVKADVCGNSEKISFVCKDAGVKSPS